MSKQLKISAILPIAIVLIGVIAMMGLTTADSIKYPYGGNMPPWVDQHSAINTIPTVIANATLWSSPVKNPYNGNLPPWVEYNITSPNMPGTIVLVINGNVKNPLSLTMDDIRAYGVSYMNISYVAHGNTSYMAGNTVSLNALLNKAVPNSGATTVVFTSTVSPSFSSNPVKLSAISSASIAVIGLTPDVGLRDYYTGISSHDMVKNLNVITVS